MAEDPTESKYRSRKFIVTLLVVFLAALFAYVNLLSPELSNVLLAALTSYNISNAWAGK